MLAGWPYQYWQVIEVCHENLSWLGAIVPSGSDPRGSFPGQIVSDSGTVRHKKSNPPTYYKGHAPLRNIS